MSECCRDYVGSNKNYQIRTETVRSYIILSLADPPGNVQTVIMTINIPKINEERFLICKRKYIQPNLMLVAILPLAS